MAVPIAFPSDWHPCKGCACVNHAIPSYTFLVTDADGPIADHPDLGKLARSNEIPNPSEEKTLQEMISDSGKRIDEVDTQVLDLKALRQAFAQSIARVDEELAALDKERQRLPDSIRSGSLFSAHCVRLHLNCRYMAIGAHFLPVNIHFYHLNWCVVTGKTFLTHSLTCGLMSISSSTECLPYPLSLSICHSASKSVIRMGTLPVTVLMGLFTVSPRVQTLRLSLPDRHFASMRKLHLSFPNLRNLVLLSSSETSEVAQHLNFGPLPHLRVFHATDISNIDKLSLPWHQITHFTNVHTQIGNGLPAHRVLGVLIMMSRLSVCRLSLDLESLTTEVVEETTLGQLQSLIIGSVYCEGFGFPSVIPFVLNSLALPALLDLLVTCFVGFTLQDQSATFTSIRRLIERSRSPLTSLYFNNGEILEDDLVHILSSTPTLQALRLMNVGGGITDQVVNDLACRVAAESDSQSSAPVPHLHTLHLSGRLDFQMEVFVGMIESRWTCHPRHLKSMDICRFVDRQSEREEEAKILALSRLDMLRSEGLDLTMSTLRV